MTKIISRQSLKLEENKFLYHQSWSSSFESSTWTFGVIRTRFWTWWYVLKTSWRRLENVLKTYDQDESICLDEDVLKTYSSRPMFAGLFSCVYLFFSFSFVYYECFQQCVCLVCSALNDRRIFCSSYLTWFLLDIFNPFLTHFTYLKITFHLQYVNQRYFPKKLSENMPKSSKSYKLFADRKFSTTPESFVRRTENLDFLGQY